MVADADVAAAALRESMHLSSLGDDDAAATALSAGNNLSIWNDGVVAAAALSKSVVGGGVWEGVDRCRRRYQPALSLRRRLWRSGKWRWWTHRSPMAKDRGDDVIQDENHHHSRGTR